VSYLDVPRIHFIGRFYADPSTVNNDPTHYQPDVTNPAPWQDPAGLHSFRILDCNVTSVEGGAAADPLVGAAVTTTDLPTPAKIVDLDVYQQAVPTIFGMKLNIALGDGTSITGQVQPVSLNSLWFNAVLPMRGWDVQYGWGSFGGDSNACGTYQTVMSVKESDWPATAGALQALKEKTLAVDGNLLLAFRFVVDGYVNVPGNQNYRYGRITGAIGPVAPNQPVQAVGPRWLAGRPTPPNANWDVPAFYGASFKVDPDRKTMVIDMANAICRVLPGGDPVDLGTVNVCVTANGTATVLGPIDCTSFAYSNSSGIVELPLSDAQLLLAQSNPITITTSRADIGPNPIFTEDPSGWYVAADNRALRMAGVPGTTAQTDIYVTRWGQPVQNVGIELMIEPVYGTTQGATVPPTNPGDTPQSVNVFQPPTTYATPTDENGKSVVALQVMHDPGARTPQLDGQLYFIVPYISGTIPPDIVNQPPAQELQISCLAWANTPTIEQPTWADILGIMEPYVKLYPGMTHKIDLSVEATFNLFATNPPWIAMHEPEPRNGICSGAIGFYMTRDFTDTRFMPVTRDLSPSKFQTVINYIANLQKSMGFPPCKPATEPAAEGGKAS
jgi:hypothetical protein